MLEINRENIIEWSQRYNHRYKGTSDEKTEIKLKRLLEKQRYLEQPDFTELCMWKTTRQRKLYETNDSGLVKEITEFSFAATNDEGKIKILMILNGVSWPIASAILHFAFPNKYPILDFRALWSLGWEKPSFYNFKFWQKYCNKISQLSQQIGLPIRVIDKALWEYSKQTQTVSDQKRKLHSLTYLNGSAVQVSIGVVKAIINERDELVKIKEGLANEYIEDPYQKDIFLNKAIQFKNWANYIAALVLVKQGYKSFSAKDIRKMLRKIMPNHFGRPGARETSLLPQDVEINSSYNNGLPCLKRISKGEYEFVGFPKQGNSM